jgi:hypothetical protein
MPTGISSPAPLTSPNDCNRTRITARFATAGKPHRAGDIVRRVPDKQDYETLAQLLADPTAWTPDEAAYMRSALRSQREAAAAWHPKDERRRRQMNEVADQIEDAIRRHDAL